METLTFTTTINAPREVVWNTMIDRSSYAEWAAAFSIGSSTDSRYEGDWNVGSKINFVSTDANGASGMMSKVIENRPYEYLALEHQGVVMGGKEDNTSDFAREWIGARENYTFTEVNGVTELKVNVDVNEDVKDDMVQGWPKSLAKLKEIAESAA